MIYQWYTNDIPMIYQWYINDIPIIYQWYTNNIPNYKLSLHWRVAIQWISAQLLSWRASQRATPSTQGTPIARGRRWPAMTGEVWGDALLLWISLDPDISWFIEVLKFWIRSSGLINMVGLMFRVRLKGYVLTMWLHCLNCKCSHYTAKRLRARHDVDYPLASPTVALDCTQLLICLDHSCSICVPLESYATKKISTYDIWSNTLLLKTNHTWNIHFDFRPDSFLRFSFLRFLDPAGTALFDITSRLSNVLQITSYA